MMTKRQQQEQMYNSMAVVHKQRVDEAEAAAGPPPREEQFARPTLWLRSDLTAAEVVQGNARGAPPVNGCRVADIRWGANHLEPWMRRHRLRHRRYGKCRAAACPCCYTPSGLKGYNACACDADQMNHLGLCRGCWRVKMGRTMDQVVDRWTRREAVEGSCRANDCGCCRYREDQVSCGCDATSENRCDCCQLRNMLE